MPMASTSQPTRRCRAKVSLTGAPMTAQPVCSYCFKAMSRMPRNGENCDICGKKVYVRHSQVLTGRAARELDDAFSPPHRRQSAEERQVMMRDFNHGAFLYFKANADA